jgi:YHS domain-containing protein
MSVTLARRSLYRLLLTPILLAFAAGVFGAGPANAGSMVNQNFFGTAIRGYDPVAYFTQGAAVKGSDAFEYEWLGGTWQFASAEHRDLFIADPIRYAPQFGGYCASGAIDGDTLAANPQAWSIVDGKLYLLYSKSSLSRWSNDTVGNIAKGDANWPTIQAGLTE